jgi:hypothetical protein
MGYELLQTVLDLEQHTLIILEELGLSEWKLKYDASI